MSGSWQARRISPATARRVAAAAAELDYSPNLQARGLRQARSGLVGMLLPEHENRYFSQLAQAFSVESRARGSLPAIVATRRDPDEEARSVESLLAYSVDALIVVGASDPAAISRRCRAARRPHVIVDQPCDGAISVVTDNESGMARLTTALLGELGRRGSSDGAPYLIGGDAALPATAARIRGFRAALADADLRASDERIIACGYRPEAARAALIALRERLGRAPSGLIINSITAFEGALPVLSQLPEAEIAGCAVGCFDYSPFLTCLRFPVWMIRQRTEELMRTAFDCLDGADAPSGTLRVVEPELVLPKGR